MFGQFPAQEASVTKDAAPAPSEVETAKPADSESAPEANAETERTEQAASNDEVSETDETQSSEDSDTDTEIVKKPKKGFERRIEKFNQRLQQKEAELNYWREQALRGTQTQQPQQQPASNDKPKFSDYNDIEAYTEAVTEWKLNRALSEYQAQTQVQSVAKTYEQRLSEFKKETPDFDDVMAEFVEDYGDVQVPEIVQVAMESDVGPKIAYYLAQNTDEVERIAKLPPHRRLIELGKLEDRLAKPVATETVPEVKPVKKVTSAAAPVKPVRGSGKVESNDLSDPNLSYSEWLKRREASLKKA